MTIGIYTLAFKELDKVYVGQSINIEKRFADHKYSFKIDKASRKMQKAFSLHGMPELYIEEVCEVKDLNNKEDYYINLFNSVEEGLNTKYLSGYRSLICGEESKLCMYSNAQISSAFLLLVQYPKFSREDITEVTGVGLNTLKDIASLVSHFWLAKEYPEEYEILVSLKGARSIGENNPFSAYTNSSIIEAMLLIVSNPCVTLPNISKALNIPYSTIKAIANGTNHRWLGKEFPLEYQELLSLKGTRSTSAGKTAEARGRVYPSIVSPNGAYYTVTNIAEFSREHNLNSGHLGAVLRGKEAHHKGWKLDSVGI